MPNLKDLTLRLAVTRLAFIDSIHLEKEILSHLSQLTTFIDKGGQCHIYLVPFQMNCSLGVTNSFFGNSFHQS